MNLKNIFIREVPYRHWHNLRVSNGVGTQKGYVWPEERVGYGLVVDPLEYRDFVDVFEDLDLEDDWLSVLGLKVRGDYRNYSTPQLYAIIEGRYPELKRQLLRLLEETEKISIGIKPLSYNKTIEHLHFRRNGSSVYSGSVRVRPHQLDNFSYWGFRDPRIFFVKADFFKNQNSKKTARPYTKFVVRR